MNKVKGIILTLSILLLTAGATATAQQTIVTNPLQSKITTTTTETKSTRTTSQPTQVQRTTTTVEQGPMTMSSEPMLIAEPPQDAPVATVTTTTKSTLKMPADGADITLMNGVEHNFGTLEGNPGKLKYRFDFVNNGNEPLVISKVTFSCKCMKVVAPMRPVKPGESAYIDITYDVEKNLEGRFSKLVTLYSNSAQPRIVFVLHGVIAPEIK